MALPAHPTPTLKTNAYHIGMVLGQHGNLSVTVALCLSLLVGMMAFALDTGFLITEKNRYQHALEAAAKAGALALGTDDPAAEARRIAVANGCPNTDALVVQLGFYDELNTYADFSVYRDFEADPNLDTLTVNEGVEKSTDGEYQYNNAVIVAVSDTTDGLTGGLSGHGISIRAASVAYLKRYAFLALGDDGIQISGRWSQGYPEFQDAAIHTNSIISFNGTEAFSGDSRVTAVDGINGGPGTTDAKAVTIPPIDWERLEAAASDHGLVHHLSQWPQGEIQDIDNWQIDAHGNHYVRSTMDYFFWPAQGDHDGRVYYFVLDADAGGAGSLIISDRYSCHPDTESYNFTIATEAGLQIGTLTLMANSDHLVLGGPGEREAVYLYTQGDIEFQDRYSHSLPEVDYLCNGVIMRAEKQTSFGIRSNPFSDVARQRVRMIADAMVFKNVVYGAGSVLFDGLFSTPCPPHLVMLGRLVAVE
jgi:Flp pilus assembly protein TadG